MNTTRSNYRLSVIGIALALVSGCPEKKGPTEAPKDLGTEDEPLMPMAGAIHDARLASGSADWVPFRELEDSEDEVAEGAADDDKADSEEFGELVQEIRDLLKDYNELVADRDIDEIIVYHIEDHQDTVKSMYETQFNLLDQLGEVETALSEELPDEKDRIAAAFEPIRSTAGGLTVSKLTAESDTLVIGDLKSGVTPTCRFVLVDDEWYIDVPDLPSAFSQIKPDLDSRAAMLGPILQALESGQIQAEPVLIQLENHVKAMVGAGSPEKADGNAAVKPPGDGGSEGNADAD